MSIFDRTHPLQNNCFRQDSHKSYNHSLLSKFEYSTITRDYTPLFILHYFGSWKPLLPSIGPDVLFQRSFFFQDFGSPNKEFLVSAPALFLLLFIPSFVNSFGRTAFFAWCRPLNQNNKQNWYHHQWYQQVSHGC